MKYKQLLVFIAIFIFCPFFVSSAISAIIYSGRLNLAGPDFNVDINKDGIIDFNTSWRQFSWGNGTSGSGYDVIVNSSMRYINTELPPMYGVGFSGAKAPLNYGELIGPVPPDGLLWSLNSNDSMIWTQYDMWSSPEITNSGLWNNLSSKYLGFELNSDLGTFYGWIHLDISASNEVILVDYAYENVSGQTIKAGYPISNYPPPIVKGLATTNNPMPNWKWSSNGGTGNYRYRFDRGTWVQSKMTSFTPSTALTEGPHTLRVQESDDAGFWSVSGTKTIVIDFTPPTAPTVTGETPTNDITPNWNWSSSGGGNGKYRYRLDNDTWTITRLTSFTPSTALTEGRHTLHVQESDAAGNWSVSGLKTIVIDLIPPTAPIVTGVTPTNNITPTWHWASGGGGNGNYRYRLGGGTWTITRAISFTPETRLSSGRHTLYVQESDAAGNWSVSGIKSILITRW